MPKRQQVGYAFVSCWFVYNLSKDVVLKLFGYNDVVLLAACRVLTDAVARLTVNSGLIGGRPRQSRTLHNGNLEIASIYVLIL